MNKVIEGKRYDTDTARMMASRTNDRPVNDFGYVEETLYRKRSGEYFLYGEGGPMTSYRTWISDNSWTGGEKIVPMSEAEAREWAEKWLDADEYEKIFGNVEEEDGSMRTVTFSIPVYLHEKLKKEGVKRGVAASQVLAELIENM